MNSNRRSVASPWDRVTLLALVILTVALFLPIIGAQVGGEDYGGHELFIRQMEATGRLTLPHFLYHSLMIGLQHLLPGLTLTSISLIVIISFEVLLAYALLLVFTRELGSVRGLEQAVWRVLLILSCMTLAPILLLTFVTHNLHWGYWDYLAITTYHSPTQIVLRPLALLLFYFALRIFSSREPRLWETALMALLVIVSTLAKPSFLICLLPASLIVAIIRSLRGNAVCWKYLSLGLIMPSLVVLAWQFWFTYHEGSSSLHPSHIIFAPLAFFHWKWPAFRWLLSIAFPLIIAISYWREAKTDLALIFAWVIFGFGSFYSYFLAESGERLIDGNFVWSGQVALFILFVASILFFVRHFRTHLSHADTRQWIAASALALHVLSGAFWYFGQLYRQPWWNG